MPGGVVLPSAAGQGRGDQRHQRGTDQPVSGGTAPPGGVCTAIQMGTDEPAGVRMTQADGPGKSHRYPVCGEVLLPAEKLLWRQAGRADVRYKDARSSWPKPASSGGSVSSASAARQRVYRAPGQDRMHRSIRSPAYAVLLGFTVSRHSRLWRCLFVRAIREDGRAPADAQGPRDREPERSPGDPAGVRWIPYRDGADSVHGGPGGREPP